MRKIFLLIVMLTANSLFAQFPSGEWILEKIDENIGADNKVSTSKMIINGRRGTRTIESKSWIQGRSRSFTEYMSPPRERGTKMLKIEDQLWTYSPSTDRTIMIAGHMLRQSVMGSDLSYEDLMEDPKLQNLYNAEVVEEVTYQERPCWILELTAKDADIAYHSRKIWVDQERFISLKEERFAKSGKKLKTTKVKRVERMDGRWVPVEIEFKDVLKRGKGTEFILDTMEFNADIPGYIFSKAALRK
ncbi:MAG: outer membrane lipoprotein-sorting protein [candidate division KSB1 bacterium]|jgi:outer membrane lipoprotein-sorting protein|nr:outer membrane lipoprotein-sorting protein [candidate division KSB1 bacterium]